MTSYTITMDSADLDEVVLALRCGASNRRYLAKTCGDIAMLADHKAKFQAEAERLDELATRLNLSPWSE